MAEAYHPTNITVPIMTTASQVSNGGQAIPYSEEFEDDVTRHLQGESTAPSQTSRLHLPLPLSHQDRSHLLHPSTVILLTEPGGSVYGGPGIPRALATTAAQDVLERENLASKEEAEEYLDKEITEKIREAEEVAHHRSKTAEFNRKLDEEIRHLEANFHMERRAMEKRAGGGTRKGV